jgi:hypothetical protein
LLNPLKGAKGNHRNRASMMMLDAEAAAVEAAGVEL